MSNAIRTFFVLTYLIFSVDFLNSLQVNTAVFKMLLRVIVTIQALTISILNVNSIQVELGTMYLLLHATNLIKYMFSVIVCNFTSVNSCIYDFFVSIQNIDSKLGTSGESHKLQLKFFFGIVSILLTNLFLNVIYCYNMYAYCGIFEYTTSLVKNITLVPVCASDMVVIAYGFIYYIVLYRLKYMRNELKWCADIDNMQTIYKSLVDCLEEAKKKLDFIVSLYMLIKFICSFKLLQGNFVHNTNESILILLLTSKNEVLNQSDTYVCNFTGTQKYSNMMITPKTSF